MSHTNFDKQLWQLFITAKKNILDKNSSEIKVDGYELEDNGKNLAFQLQSEYPAQYLSEYTIIGKNINNLSINTILNLEKQR